MSEQSTKQYTLDVVGEVIRQKEIVAMSDILYLLPDLVDCVEYDQDYMRAKVSGLLRKKTVNPINALLGLLGLRIVNINDTIDGFLDGSNEYIEVDREISEHGSRNMLTISHERIRALVEQIADILKRAEDERFAQDSSNRDYTSMLVGKLNTLEKQYNQLMIDHKAMCEDVLTAAQSMLSKAAACADDLMKQQAEELLEDFNARAVWSAEGSGYSERALFNIYVYDDPAAIPAKPCIVGRDGILLKGVKYIAKEA